MAKKKDLFVNFEEVKSPFVLGDQSVDDGVDVEEDEAPEDEEEGQDAEIPEEAPDEDAENQEPEQEAADQEGEPEDEDEEFSYSPLVEDLSAEGILFIADDKEYEDTEDGFREVIKDTVQHELQKVVGTLAPTAQRIVELALKGGTEEDLQLALQLEDAVDWEEADLEEEDVQKAAVEEAMRLREPELEDEEIAERIADLEDLGKLRKQAERDVKFLQKNQDEQKAAVEKQIAAREAAELEAYEQQIEKAKSHILKAEELVPGMKLDKKEKEAFIAYLTVKDKNGQTEADKRNTYERRMQKEYLNFKNFSVQQVQRDEATKVIKSVKKQLSRYNSKGQPNGGQPVRVAKPTEDIGRILMPWQYPTE